MMTRFRKWHAIALALAVLATAAGCDKRPTGFDPNPSSPEGATSPDVRLLTYRNTGLRVLARDYASATIDSADAEARGFDGPASMPLLLVLDGTPSNTFETFRRDDGGRFERTTDFPLQSKFKFVDVGIDEFFTPDPAPSRYTPATYLARGLLDGAATHASPLSKESRMAQPSLLPITYNGQLDPKDSLFVISWVGVPGAVGYWIHAFERPNPVPLRLISALPAPISYLTRGDLVLGFLLGNNPGGSVQYRLGDPLFKLKSNTPLIGHDYFVRISAVDADGQVFAQNEGDLDSASITPDLSNLAPPNYSADKTVIYFSSGGTKVARRPRTVIFGRSGLGAGDPLGGGQADPGIMAPLVRHVADVRFPVIGPFRELGTRPRARGLPPALLRTSRP